VTPRAVATQNALQPLVTAIGLALAPFRFVASPPQAVAFFRQLGYEIPPGAFGSALTTFSAKCGDLLTAIGSLAISTDDAGVTVALGPAVEAISGAITALGELHDQLKLAVPGLPALDELPRRITDHLLLDYVERRFPEMHGNLHVFGLIENEPAPDPGVPARRIHWERLGRFLSAPATIVEDVYSWSTDFNAEEFLFRLERIMRAARLPGGAYPQSLTIQELLGNTGESAELRFPIFQKGLTPATYVQFGVTFSPVEPSDSAGRGIALLPYLTGATEFKFDVCDRGELLFESTAPIQGVGIVVRPPLNATGILNLTAPFHAVVTIREKPDKSTELILLGSPGGTRLSVQGLGINWFLSGTPDRMDIGVDGEISALRLVIDTGDGDGFIQKVLSGVKLRAETPISFGFSLQSGFSLHGGGKLALELGTHIDLPPVSVDALRFALQPADDHFALDAGVLMKFDLGPLHAVVEDIGLRSLLRFTHGNLGPVNLDVGFKPPTGVGLSMDTGGFKGGGFLRLDPDKGEYAGALELDFHGLFTVKAIGLINTKMPDGQPGFSVLIVISAEFTPIQLSFGFTLNGVGGLFGLNRTLFVDALAEGIRTNAIKSILFPEDVVANITRIISDIRQFFPPQDEHFVVGPMAKLGWGTPSIITAELGLLLDLPNPMFAIVGVLQAMLPAEEAPILHLQVNFIGVMDFDRGYIFFRADLYDSRLLIYTITGSMAFLVSWGEQKTFALSIGGFHPDFHDAPAIPALPDAFTNMARIGLSLLSDDNPRLKAESYFAVTSNTVQFGAKVELYAGAGSFNVYGFLGHDVLFQFDPFRFIADLYGGIALRDGTDVIASINLTARLSGPTPWDARGTASLTILLFEIDVDFHVTWGDPPPAIDTQKEDLLGLLQGQLGDTRNWRADLPPQNHLHVSLRTLDPPNANEPLVIHPAGVLTFSQRAMPLNGYVIEKFGTLKPLADNQFTLSGATCGGVPMPADYLGVREQFAPAQFSELSDHDKLSRNSFENLPSGFSLTGTSNLQATLPVSRGVDYELSYMHRKPKRTVFKGIVSLGADAYRRLVRGCAVRQSALANQQVRVSMNAPPPVVLPKEEFAVASVADLTAYAAPGETAPRFTTQAEAYQYQQNLIRRDASLAGQVQVVSHYELAG
jgi:hypothetical protein